MPITTELALVDDPLDPIVSDMGYQGFCGREHLNNLAKNERPNEVRSRDA